MDLHKEQIPFVPLESEFVDWREPLASRIEGEPNKKHAKMSEGDGQMAAAALETLRGARGLPPAEAAAMLRDFLASISSPIPESDRLADASGALRTLVDSLEKDGTAGDDAWEHAIETMLSLANESGSP